MWTKRDLGTTWSNDQAAPEIFDTSAQSKSGVTDAEMDGNICDQKANPNIAATISLRPFPNWNLHSVFQRFVLALVINKRDNFG